MINLDLNSMPHFSQQSKNIYIYMSEKNFKLK